MHSLVRHEGGSHLGTFYRIAGPLIARLLVMPRKVAAHLLHPDEHVRNGSLAMHLLDAHKAAVEMHESFTENELQTALMLAPRGLVITMPGDPSSVAKDLPPTVDTDVLPAGPLSPRSARGARHIAAGTRRLSD